METPEQLKERLIKTVREWVKLDNEIAALNKEVASRRQTKKEISAKLIDITRKTGIEEFGFNDGQLVYVKKSKKKPITQKQLLSSLSSYLGDDTRAEELHKYLMDSREEVVEEKICRK